MRPQSIVNFERLYLSSLALSLLQFAIGYDDGMADLDVDPALADVFGVIIFGVGFVVFAISLALWFLIARKASTVAKWILTGLTALGLLGLPDAFATSDLIVIAGYLVTSAMQVVAIGFLFTGEARAWLASDGVDTNVTDIFE